MSPAMVEELAKFTTAARRALAGAQTEARLGGASEIRGEHLLLGILQAAPPGSTPAPGRVALHLLMHVGLLPGQVRSALESRLAPEAGAGELRLSESAARALELAVAEARLSTQDQIGDEHLLLALLQLDGTVACELLRDLGLDLPRARAAAACVRLGPAGVTKAGLLASLRSRASGRQPSDGDPSVLGLEREVYERLATVAARQRMSVADVLKAFVELGLLTIAAVGTDSGTLVLRQDGVEREILKL
jgi:ATP-dependent Clp protease ATP-binding subunit ClpA